MKDKDGGWAGRTWNYIYKTTKDGAIHYQWRESRSEPAFTFTDEQEREIRRAFGSRFPEVEKAAFLRRMTGIMTKMASDKPVLATDPRMARDRVETVAKRLAEAAAEISKMTETEKDIFELATSADPVVLTHLAEALEKAVTGFRKAADGHALGRGEKVAGSDATALFVAAQAAAAWRAAFGIEPKARGRSTFANVLDAILDETGLPRLGVDAIRSAIKGPPKSRKS